MKRISIPLVAILVVLGGLGVAHGQRLGLLATLMFAHPPSTAFSAAAVPPAPDYSQRASWAADGWDAGSGPAGVMEAYPEGRKVDVFFIHPTSFFSNDKWNQPIDDAETNTRTDKGSLRGQASVFQGCCRIYAPRYRQFTFSAIIHYDANSRAAEDLAYSDVKRAFEYYLAHYNHGQPFIIASHSQGSRHAVRLIPEMIDGTPLMKQFVAAYIIGNWIPQSWFDRMKDIKPCEHADDIACVVTWSTLLEGSDAHAQRVAFAQRQGEPDSLADEAFVCINPLSWSAGPALAPASLDIGGWTYGTGNTPRPLDPHLVAARCDDGALSVSDPGPDYHAGVLPGGNYHNYDYQLAYMNIRQNAIDRTKAFLAAHR